MALKRDITIRRQRPAPLAQDEPVALKAVPGRRKRRPFLRIILRLIIVAALIAGGCLIWQNRDSISPENLIYWLNNKLAGEQTGGGFSENITGSSVKSMLRVKEGLALLTDTSLTLYNNKGGRLFQRQHGFASPIVRAAGKWILVYDAGGNGLRLETLASTTWEKSVDNRITSAALSNDGLYALVTDSSEGYTSEIIAYNRYGEKIYHWVSAELTFLDVALSPDGKSLAAVGVTAQSGAMKSSLLIFDLNKEKPVAQYDSNSVMLFAIEYFPSGTMAAVGNGEIWVCNKSGSIYQKHAFDDRELMGYTIGESSVSAVLREPGNSQGGIVMTVNPSGDMAYTAPFEGSFRSIAPHETGILLLTSERLIFIDPAGIAKSIEVMRDGRMVCSIQNKAVVLGLTSFSEYPLKFR